MAELYILILFTVGAYFFLFSVSNVWYIHSRTMKKKLENEPFVSVLIPARNEEDNIGRCLDSFLKQEYKNYEILVLDDNSTDRTNEIIKGYVEKNPGKVRLLNGKPLPENWRGKCFAMKQLTEEAKGEYFLFTDADTVHTEKSISLMMANMIGHNADMVSGYLGQKMETFGEKITVPLIYLMTALCIPLGLNEKLKYSFFSTAIGQYIGIKASSFKAIGGYDRIKDVTTEDVYLARVMKKEGYVTKFLDFKDAACCRMYDGYRKAVMGISKNIFDFLGKHSLVLIPLAMVVLPVLCLPFPLMVAELYRVLFCGQIFELWHFALVANFVLVLTSWLVIFKSRRIPLWIALLYPLIHLNLVYLVVVSYVRSKSGKGYTWKGRVVK